MATVVAIAETRAETHVRAVIPVETPAARARTPVVIPALLRAARARTPAAPLAVDARTPAVRLVATVAAIVVAARIAPVDAATAPQPAMVSPSAASPFAV